MANLLEICATKRIDFRPFRWKRPTFDSLSSGRRAVDLACVSTDGLESAFAAFALMDHQGAGVWILITAIKRCHLGAAHSRGKEKFEDCSVPDAERVFGVRTVERKVDFLAAERFRQVAGLLVVKIEIGVGYGGVGGDDIGAVKTSRTQGRRG